MSVIECFQSSADNTRCDKFMDLLSFVDPELLQVLMGDRFCYARLVFAAQVLGTSSRVRNGDIVPVGIVIPAMVVMTCLEWMYIVFFTAGLPLRDDYKLSMASVAAAPKAADNTRSAPASL